MSGDENRDRIFSRRLSEGKAFEFNETVQRFPGYDFALGPGLLPAIAYDRSLC